MDETLLDAYRHTRYLVCVDGVEWADIRIGQMLPTSLLAVVGNRCWGFITAWNPLSVLRDDTLNQSAQRDLAASLNALPETLLLPAIGIGTHGWSEPSFFVVGPAISDLDVLADEHQQIAYVHGQGRSTAILRVLRN